MVKSVEKIQIFEIFLEILIKDDKYELKEISSEVKDDFLNKKIMRSIKNKFSLLDEIRTDISVNIIY